MYDISSRHASPHKIIRTISFNAYARAKYGLLLFVRNTAAKLVVIENVEIKRFAVPKYLRIK